MEEKVCGQIVHGGFGEILIRVKKGAKVEIGSLLAVGEKPIYILQVYDLLYGSQLEKNHLELTSGLVIEEKERIEFIEEEIQNYVLAKAKVLLEIDRESEVVRVPKSLPEFFGLVREVSAELFEFMKKENENGIFIGKLRSGSKILDIPVRIPLEDSLSHHILISATTGRGKSNLLKVMLASIMDNRGCGVLVIDAHDEYYGRAGKGLKDVEGAEENLVYYTPFFEKLRRRNVRDLVVNATSIKPWDFGGVISLTDAQSQAMYVLYSMSGEDWIKVLLTKDFKELCEKMKTVKEDTLAALHRKLSFAMERFYKEKSIFSLKEHEGVNTVEDIVRALEEGKKVIVDASTLSNESELLLASIIARNVFERHQQAKKEGALDSSPVVSIALEEAPRVLRNEGSIFSTIAREGRKFKVGLIGVTQLASLIPGEVLANINTKIILGTEMESERKALIASASQDLSTDAKLIASLEKGEALVTSIFTKFAIPISSPKFEDYLREKLRNS